MEIHEKIVKFRQIFDELPKDMQLSELKRLERIVYNKKAIKLTHPREPERERMFSDINTVVKFLKNNGFPNASRSNIHKALRGERKKAYGYTVRYED